jgi:predicted RNA-binding Zn-ribbon protein involved in translation (DUF1610 family)
MAQEHSDQLPKRPLSEVSNCPNCGVSLIGPPIPEEHREHYGGATNFRREIGHYDIERDRTVSLSCPDCGYEEER